MKFYDLVKKLQNENEGYIILVRCGIFYNAIGKDAVFMQEKFGLGTICIKSETCKNGIPVSTIQKFIPKLQKSGYSYKIYDYSKETKRVKELYTIEAKQILEEIKEFLKRNLELELNSKTQIFKSKQGVNFCGYKINEYRLKIRDKGKRKLKKKVKDIKLCKGK